MTDHPLSEEPFPDFQPEIPLAQLHSIPSCPIAGHQREEISTSISADPLEEFVDCDEVVVVLIIYNQSLNSGLLNARLLDILEQDTFQLFLYLNFCSPYMLLTAIKLDS